MLASAGSLAIGLFCGSTAPARAVLAMTHWVAPLSASRQSSMSAWVTVYVPWQVVLAPGASVVASQVTPETRVSVTVRLCSSVVPLLVTV